MTAVGALENRSLLVVDIELVALPVGLDKARIADVALQFDIAGLDQPWLGSSVEPRPFRTNHELDAGVHLHWQLPRGLTRGEAGAASGTVFPAVPDRWLVQRWTDLGATAPDASWVIESDRLWSGRVAHDDPCLAQNRLSPSVLMLPAERAAIRRGTRIARRLGRAFPADTWAERATPTERLAPFTAVGYGHPAFAAALPHCYNVFGFYDPLPARTASIAYTVLGWYSDPSLDPTADAESLGFTVPAGTAPERTVLRARTRDVQWHATTTSRTASSLQATLGATTIDAVATQLGGAATDVGAAQRYLEVLQLGLVAHLGEVRPGVLKDWDDRIRAAEFGALPGGTAWSVKP